MPGARGGRSIYRDHSRPDERRPPPALYNRTSGSGSNDLFPERARSLREASSQDYRDSREARDYYNSPSQLPTNQRRDSRDFRDRREIRFPPTQETPLYTHEHNQSRTISPRPDLVQRTSSSSLNYFPSRRRSPSPAYNRPTSQRPGSFHVDYTDRPIERRFSGNRSPEQGRRAEPPRPPTRDYHSTIRPSRESFTKQSDRERIDREREAREYKASTLNKPSQAPLQTKYASNTNASHDRSASYGNSRKVNRTDAVQATADDNPILPQAPSSLTGQSSSNAQIDAFSGVAPSAEPASGFSEEMPTDHTIIPDNEPSTQLSDPQPALRSPHHGSETVHQSNMTDSQQPEDYVNPFDLLDDTSSIDESRPATAQVSPYKQGSQQLIDVQETESSDRKVSQHDSLAENFPRDDDFENPRSPSTFSDASTIHLAHPEDQFPAANHFLLTSVDKTDHKDLSPTYDSKSSSRNMRSGSQSASSEIYPGDPVRSPIVEDDNKSTVSSNEDRRIEEDNTLSIKSDLDSLRSPSPSVPAPAATPQESMPLSSGGIPEETGLSDGLARKTVSVDSSAKDEEQNVGIDLLPDPLAEKPEVQVSDLNRSSSAGTSDHIQGSKPEIPKDTEQSAEVIQDTRDASMHVAHVEESKNVEPYDHDRVEFLQEATTNAVMNVVQSCNISDEGTISDNLSSGDDEKGSRRPLVFENSPDQMRTPDIDPAMVAELSSRHQGDEQLKPLSTSISDTILHPDTVANEVLAATDQSLHFNETSSPNVHTVPTSAQELNAVRDTVKDRARGRKEITNEIKDIDTQSELLRQRLAALSTQEATLKLQRQQFASKLSSFTNGKSMRMFHKPSTKYCQPFNPSISTEILQCNQIFLKQHRDPVRQRLYSSPDEYIFYQDNCQLFEQSKGQIISVLRAQKVASIREQNELRKEYEDRQKKWLKYAAKCDRQRLLEIQQEEADAVVALAIPGPTRGTRNKPVGYEIKEAMVGVDIPNNVLNEAVIPSLLVDAYQRELYSYLDLNHLVTDPLAFYKINTTDPRETWTESEQALFFAGYKATPKQFGVIAAGIPGRTAKECVLHYYKTKKFLDYRTSGKPKVKSSGRGRGRAKKVVAGRNTRRTLLATVSSLDSEGGEIEEEAEVKSLRKRRAITDVDETVRKTRALRRPVKRLNEGSTETQVEQVSTPAVLTAVKSKPNPLRAQANSESQSDAQTLQPHQKSTLYQAPYIKGVSHPFMDTHRFPWTDHDEAQFLELIKRFGTDYTTLAVHMPGKSKEQIQSHFDEFLVERNYRQYLPRPLNPPSRHVAEEYMSPVPPAHNFPARPSILHPPQFSQYSNFTPPMHHNQNSYNNFSRSNLPPSNISSFVSGRHAHPEQHHQPAPIHNHQSVLQSGGYMPPGQYNYDYQPPSGQSRNTFDSRYSSPMSSAPERSSSSIPPRGSIDSMLNRGERVHLPPIGASPLGQSDGRYTSYYNHPLPPQNNPSSNQYHSQNYGNQSNNRFNHYQPQNNDMNNSNNYSRGQQSQWR